MKQWAEIRDRVFNDGVSKREILRETGMHWTTLEKILAHSAPPGYRQEHARPQPKLGPYVERIQEILRQDREQNIPRKQRHTAKRIFELLREEGYSGGYTQVKAKVRELKRCSQEVFVPLRHDPGDAQVDFGHALIGQHGILRKVVFFVMTLPHSDAIFVQAYERECREVYWEAHQRAFAFFGGVPRRITYDNTSVLVSKILGAHERAFTEGFLHLQSHYLFKAHFCRVRRANEKGVVENMVRYTRQNFFVPVPQAKDLATLNERLREQCRADLKRRLRGKPGPKAVLLEEDRAAFHPLPTAPFDACQKQSTVASSLSLVRFDGNDYSVPVHYAHHPVVVKGYVDEVRIAYRDEVIAGHRRLWHKEDVVFEPLHYLPLLERKPGALDHARPLSGWQLPDCFAVLRRRLETELGGGGTREYIRVLRLLEQHPPATLAMAVTKALGIHALTRDAIAQYLMPQEPWEATTFRLDGREHLRRVKVAATDIRCYGELLAVGGGR